MTARFSLASLILLLTLLFAGAALAVKPDEILADPALEARARTLSEELRCMVCQNQSIDESDADLARDLRVLVRQRLVAGDTDRQVIDYIVSRYGEFVLSEAALQPAQCAALGHAGPSAACRRDFYRADRPVAPFDACGHAHRRGEGSVWTRCWVTNPARPPRRQDRGRVTNEPKCLCPQTLPKFHALEMAP